MKVYVDGQFVDGEDAVVGVFDAGLQHGVGLFETMHAYGGEVFRCEKHVERLVGSALELGLSDRLQVEPLSEAVALTVAKNDMEHARVKLMVTGGDMSLLSQAAGRGASVKEGKQRATVIISASEPTVYPEHFLTEGVRVVIADGKANPFDMTAGHKTINYWGRLTSLVGAAQHEAAEALWFSITNHLCGGAVSNVILVKDGELLTPYARGEEEDGALRSPVLPGITREVVFEVAGELDMPVRKGMLTINDVLEAEEVFLTNSSWLVLPVVKVEKEVIGEGKPGEVTQRVFEGVMGVIEEECFGEDSTEEALGEMEFEIEGEEEREEEGGK